MKTSELITNILIIDDQPQPLINLEQLVLPPESNLVRVTSVEQAIPQLAAQPFAVILINVTARPASAVELAQRLRKKAPTTPLVFVLPAGANWQELLGEQSLPLLDYLIAPVDLQILQTRLAALAALYHQSRQQPPASAGLRDSEVLFSTLAETTAAAIFVFQGTGIKYVNHASTTLTGFSEPELLQMNFWNVLHPDVREAMRQEGLDRQQHIESYNPRMETRLLTKEGHTRWIDVTLGRFIFEGQPAIIGTAFDITDRKQAESALQENEGKYRNIFYNSPLGIMHFDKSGVITDCNEKFVEILGSSKKALIGLDMLRQLKDQKMVAQITAALCGGEGYYEDDYRSITADKVTPVRVYLKGIHNKAGEIISGVGLIEDITESKQAEIRFTRFMDHFPGLAFIDDQDNRLVYCNQHYALRFNQTPANIIGKHLSELYPPHLAARFARENKKVLSENQVVRSEFTYPFNGQPSHWLTIKFPVGVEPKPLLGAISLDITEKVRLEHETEQLQLINQTNAELARAARLKDEFLANMSHELRTPLHAILGKAEILQEGVYGPLTENQRNSLQILEESGRHLLALINDILDLSKIEAGKMEIYADDVPVREICEASLRLVKHVASSKRLSVTTNIDNNVTDIKTDMRRLKQMLVNLLSNATKFTQNEGEIGLIVTGDSMGQVVHFTVWDTGIGIAPEEIKRLFQPFTQLDSGLNRSYGGTGLGLSLVARLAEMQGGSVSVESTPGKGSRFTITLPWLPVGSPVEQMPSNAPFLPNAREELAEHKVLILLVEDNEANIVATSEYLGAFGYNVVVARNGRDALAALDSTQPDLILMDIQMPEMDGLEAIGRIRKMETMQDKPIIALTALAMPGDRERCLEAGANAYVSKPVSLKKLIRTIDALLNGNLN